jgi:hypothetical protein
VVSLHGRTGDLEIDISGKASCRYIPRRLFRTANDYPAATAFRIDWAESGHRFENHRRITVIVAKTLAYAMVVIVLGTCERLFEGFRAQGSLGAAMQFVIAHASIRHFLGLVLLLGLVVGSFLTWQEIDDALGEGALLRLLLEPRARKIGTTTSP